MNRSPSSDNSHPADLLSTRRILTGGAPGEGDASRRRSVAARFQSADAIRDALEHARGMGFKSCVTIGDARLFNAIGTKPNSALPAILPIVPNIQGFMREAVEHGIVGAGWLRVRRMGLPALCGLGLRGVGRAPAILKRDFPTMLLCFIELELADFRRYDPKTVFLQPQMTDLALAMNNPRILEAFVQAVRRLTGGGVGFVTQNFATLATRCAEWGIEPAAIIAPWERSGAGMRPKREICEAKLRTTKWNVWADRAGRIDAPVEELREYFGECGVRGALRDDDEALGIAGDWSSAFPWRRQPVGGTPSGNCNS